MFGNGALTLKEFVMQEPLRSCKVFGVRDLKPSKRRLQNGTRKDTDESDRKGAGRSEFGAAV